MTYKVDILKENIEQRTITLDDDYEGKAIATLIRRQTDKDSDIAVLYIHGFNDYFFQQEMAFNFNNARYHFYAIDLRKYGRSYLPHQKLNDIKDLKSYYEEIDKALTIIKGEGNKKVILIGHSTGGLIATLYAKDNTGSGKFDGIILNSPFFDFNMSSKILERLIPLAASIGKLTPSIKVDGVLSQEYGESLHKDYSGEWDYNLQWKPNTAPAISLGWLRAIRNGHKELRVPFKIDEPVLLLHSTETITDKKDLKQIHSMDAVLSVDDMKKIIKNINGDVKVTAIEGGMHDLILSKKGIRENVYSVIMEWMKQF